MATTGLHIIVNPAAGVRHDVVGRLRAILDRSDRPYTVHVTAGPDDAARLARAAISAGAERVGVCGGDGTVAQVAGVLAGSGIPLGVLPGGSGNFLVRVLGIPLGLEAAVALLTAPRPALRRLDLGLLNDQPFLVRAGIGFEAEVIAHTPAIAKHRLGVFGYGIGGLRALVRLRRLRFRVSVDGTAEDVRGLHLFIANTPGIGRLGLVLPGDAHPDDALLDALTLDLAPGALFGFAAGAFHLRMAPRCVWHRRGRSLHVVVERPLVAHADGEVLRAASFSVALRPAAVTVIVPR